MGTSWAALSGDIQLRILSFLSTSGGSLARLATVSRQWQAIIERHNFEQINLTLWRIPDLGLMTRRNRAFVKYIWLSLELEEYDCLECTARNPDHNADHFPCENTTNDCIITAAMHDLLLTLSAWEPQGDLKLDISIHSPSDSKHWFKYLTFGPDAISHNGTMSTQRNDPEHGWNPGQPPSAPTELALRNVFGEILSKVFLDKKQEVAWWQTLPKVPAITSMLLRQQNRRQWKPLTLTCMLSRFPELEEFHYEPWRAWSKHDQTIRDHEYCSLFDSLASQRLRNLVLFENFDERYSSCFADCNSMRAPTLWVGQAIAKASLELEHLSASFIIDASHFFDATRSYWNWSRLKSLTLTSQLLDARQSPDKISDMLEAAALTALKMPKLTTLEIWNGRVGSAALFRYQLKDTTGCATLNWKATRKFELRPRVIMAWKAVAWKAVAHAHTSNNFFRVQESLGETIQINSHADAISYLELFKVLRPISLQQILTAHQMRNESVPQGGRLARPKPSGIHKRRSFSGRYWAKALTYRSRIRDQYVLRPITLKFRREELIPWLRETNGVDPDLEKFLVDPRYT